jgi:peroxiredoxin
LREYQRSYPDIRAAGADVVALSVDDRARSEALRAQLGLEFPLLCDTERVVVRDWDLYNSRERDGIAVPAVFVIGTNRVVRYRSIDSTARRVRTDGGARRAARLGPSVERSAVWPQFRDWRRAIGNAIRYRADSKRQ